MKFSLQHFHLRAASTFSANTFCKYALPTSSHQLSSQLLHAADTCQLPCCRKLPINFWSNMSPTSSRQGSTLLCRCIPATCAMTCGAQPTRHTSMTSHALAWRLVDQHTTWHRNALSNGTKEISQQTNWTSLWKRSVLDQICLCDCKLLELQQGYHHYLHTFGIQGICPLYHVFRLSCLGWFWGLKLISSSRASS